MTRRLGRTDIHTMLEIAGVHPSKALGQNFVVDPNVTERIARLAGVGPSDHVIEIGAGLGSLTVALAATGARVSAVEVDTRLAEALATVVPASVRVIRADALELDIESLVHDGWAQTTPAAQSAVLVANLPYNVATPLILTVLEHAPSIGRLLVMVQREVGERIVAGAGNRTYGAVSVRVAYFAEARLVGSVGPEVFHPRPHVASVLVELRRRTSPAVDPGAASYAELNALVGAGFTGRRKMLRRSLSGLVTEDVFVAAGIASDVRAEDLDVVAWGKLAACRRTASSPTPN